MEMEKAEDVETTIAVTEGTATVVTMAAASSSTHVVTAEVYAKPYTKTTESRGVHSTARSEKKEAKEREVMIQKQKDEEERIAKEKEAKEQRKVVERALLEEEEKAQAEVLCKLREKEEKKKPKNMSEKESKNQEKEAKNTSEKESKKQEKEAKKRKYIEEEEEQYTDDKEHDPDFDPDKEFIKPDDMVIEEEDEDDMFQVHKHSHALNFSEAGEFVVWVRGELDELQRAVHRGKDMYTHYRTFVSILRDAVVKMGSWGPIEGADVKAVM